MNRNSKIAIFTVVEVITLVVWLILALEAETAIQGIIAVAVLIVGFTLEHLITYNVIHNRPLFDFRGLPIGQKLVVSLVETGIWVVWLVILQTGALSLEAGLAIASIFMFATLMIEHTLSDNVFTGRPLFSRLLEPRTIGFTMVETAGAGIWFLFQDQGFAVIGIVILFAASFAEHILAVRLSHDERITQRRK